MISPNIRHWHGAAPDKLFAHLAMSELNAKAKAPSGSKSLRHRLHQDAGGLITTRRGRSLTAPAARGRRRTRTQIQCAHRGRQHHAVRRAGKARQCEESERQQAQTDTPMRQDRGP
jgi:hypothetical protein